MGAATDIACFDESKSESVIRNPIRVVLFVDLGNCTEWLETSDGVARHKGLTYLTDQRSGIGRHRQIAIIAIRRNTLMPVGNTRDTSQEKPTLT